MASPFSETEAKLHPYQKGQTDGPKGAYEARKVEGGLYVRVDMPGVPPDNIKVFKNSEQRTVTFTGKSPPMSATENEAWDFLADLCYRVYGGYVALDRDPADVEVKHEVKAGCLRLFFPDSDGTLHFLSPPALQTDGDDGGTGSPSSQSSGEEGEAGETQGEGDDEIPLTFIEQVFNQDLGLGLKYAKREHINPYVLSGPKGVSQHKLHVRADGLQIFLRLDVPGASDEAYGLIEKDGSVMVSARCPKDSPFDEGGREYYCLLSPQCPGSKYNVVKHELKNGVLTYLVRWPLNQFLDTPLVHSFLPPQKREKPGRTSTSNICFVNGETPAPRGTR